MNGIRNSSNINLLRLNYCIVYSKSFFFDLGVEMVRKDTRRGVLLLGVDGVDSGAFCGVSSCVSS